MPPFNQIELWIGLALGVVAIVPAVIARERRDLTVQLVGVGVVVLGLFLANRASVSVAAFLVVIAGSAWLRTQDRSGFETFVCTFSVLTSLVGLLATVGFLALWLIAVAFVLSVALWIVLSRPASAFLPSQWTLLTIALGAMYLALPDNQEILVLFGGSVPAGGLAILVDHRRPLPSPVAAVVAGLVGFAVAVGAQARPASAFVALAAFAVPLVAPFVEAMRRPSRGLRLNAVQAKAAVGVVHLIAGAIVARTVALGERVAPAAAGAVAAVVLVAVASWLVAPRAPGPQAARPPG